MAQSAAVPTRVLANSNSLWVASFSLSFSGVYMNLNQITLPVTDMSLAVDFYLTLGFTQIVDTPHYARFMCPVGDATFSLSLVDEASSSNGAVIYFEHQALDEWVDALRAKHIVFDTLPTNESYLWREASLRDPSGNKIKLYWAGENRLNPPWRVTKSK